MKRCVNCFELQDEQFSVCPYCGYYEGKGPKEPFFLHPGTRLNHDRYIIGKSVGNGGFGIIYKAWDEKLQIAVAIKEFYLSGAVSRRNDARKITIHAKNRTKEVKDGIQGFLEEARRVAKFNREENIVHVFDFFEENETAYIVMEYLEGSALNIYLQDNRPSTKESIDIIFKVCDALKKVHADGIIHRDISPDNIYVCDDGKIKLIDFGAARFSKNRDYFMSIILKQGFAPPEQYQSVSNQGPWTDIYALGATLYYLLTGQKPEESTNRKIKDTLPPPHELNPSINRNVSNSVMRAMAIELPLRFQTIEAFEKALKGEKKVLSVEKERRRRKRRRFTGISVAVTVLVAIALYLIANVEKQRQEETLPDANVKIWYALSGDEQIDTGKENALKAITQEFTNSYENVIIEYEGIEEAEYVSYIQNAIMQNQKVGIFESSYFDEGYLNEVTINLEAVATSEDAKKCYGFKNYSNYFENEKQIPLGFIAPAIYCNKLVTTYKGDSVGKLEAMLNAKGEMQYCVAVNEEQKDAFMTAFGKDSIDGESVRIVNDMEDFVKGQCAFYFSSTEEYAEIQKQLPARYEMLSLDVKVIRADYKDLYSISSSLSRDEQKAAVRFLSFLLSDNSQDYLYLRNQTGVSPVDQNVLDTFGIVYRELEQFFHNAADYVFR